ncbi:MAG: TonB-dependent receptor [Bacteroides sp.]|nr:TonB-dependent receptor [Bacteroides sp.]
MKRYILPAMIFALGVSATAQNLNTEITVTHQIVPEEQAATRLRLLPEISLPTVSQGRLPMSATTNWAELTPLIRTLEPAPWACSLPRSNQKGYAALAYGPLWNLGASAGLRAVDRDSLQVEAFMQFDGFAYRTKYPDNFFGDDRKVSLRRNSALIGGRSTWIASGGTLSALLTYGFSNYNMPFPVDPSTVNANLGNLSLGWNGRTGKIDYRAAVDYTLLAFGFPNQPTHNIGNIELGANWHASTYSHWGLTLREQLMRSTSGQTKGITHIEPAFQLTTKPFTARIAAGIDLKSGNTDYKSLFIVPKIDISWRPSAQFNLWAKTDGRMEANSRAMLYEVQPYLHADYEAGFSRLFTADAGLTLGPWAGASIGFFGGYAWTWDWLIPMDGFGRMHGVDMRGAHWGGDISYDYRRYLSLKVRAEMAQNPKGDYSKGYAIWGDHAKFNLTASATVRLITPLAINLSYHFRSSRNKESLMMPSGYQNLMTISKLNASVSYQLNQAWTIFVNGENLLNRQWYLGPSIPSQGIVGMLGAEYKF